MTGTPPVFFFPTWKNDFLPWKILPLPPWKIQSVREKISKTTREKLEVPVKILKKSLTWKLNFSTWKKTKIAYVKTKKWPWKILTKSLNVPFFADVFQILCQFVLYPATFYFIDRKFCAWKWNALRENFQFFLRENSKRIRENKKKSLREKSKVCVKFLKKVYVKSGFHTWKIWKKRQKNVSRTLFIFT